MVGLKKIAFLLLLEASLDKCFGWYRKVMAIQFSTFIVLALCNKKEQSKKVLNFDFVYFFKPENERFYKKINCNVKLKKHI